MKQLLQKVLIACLVLILTMSIVGCAEDDTSPEYAESIQAFSEFDQIEPLLTRYYSGLRRAVDKTDPADLNTFLPDEDTQLALQELQTYFKEYEQYRLDNAKKEDRAIFYDLLRIECETVAYMAACDMQIYVHTMDSDFLVPSSTPEELVEEMKAHLDKAYKALATGDVSVFVNASS